jgi:hypothetical protein
VVLEGDGAECCELVEVRELPAKDLGDGHGGVDGAAEADNLDACLVGVFESCGCVGDIVGDLALDLDADDGVIRGRGVGVLDGRDAPVLFHGVVGAVVAGWVANGVQRVTKLQTPNQLSG